MSRVMDQIILLTLLSWSSAFGASVSEPGSELSRIPHHDDKVFDNVISEINAYIRENKLNVHKLMDFPLNSGVGSLSLFDGLIRDFSTVEAHKCSVQSQNDGSLYWTLGISLEQLLVQYDFQSDILNFFKNYGTIKVTVPGNSILLSGTVEGATTSNCSTSLEIATFDNLPELEVEVEPFSVKNFFLKYVLRFTINHGKTILTPTINSNLKDFILGLVSPSTISDILCKNLSQLKQKEFLF